MNFKQPLPSKKVVYFAIQQASLLLGFTLFIPTYGLLLACITNDTFSALENVIIRHYSKVMIIRIKNSIRLLLFRIPTLRSAEYQYTSRLDSFYPVNPL